jgi:hypothetical protein
MAGCVTDALQTFLQTEGRRRWSWRDTNCGLWVADWIAQAGGRDPATTLRGRAETPEQWKALLNDEGGFVPVVGAVMDDAGYERTQSPRRGDVAIVSVPVSLASDRMPVVGTVAGICVASASGQDLWPVSVVRSLRGLRYQRFAVVTAWRVG